jgi:hypothetical protein
MPAQPGGSMKSTKPKEVSGTVGGTKEAYSKVRKSYYLGFAQNGPKQKEKTQ